MSRSAPDQDERSLLGSLAVPVVIVAIAGLIGWGLLLIAKGIVVTVTYALGIALIVVTVLLWARLVRGRTGRARWRRHLSLTGAVVLGAGLLFIAHEISRRGWLIIAIPAAVVAIWALVDRVRDR